MGNVFEYLFCPIHGVFSISNLMLIAAFGGTIRLTIAVKYAKLLGRLKGDK